MHYAATFGDAVRNSGWRGTRRCRGYELHEADCGRDAPREEDAAIAGVAKVPRVGSEEEGEGEVGGYLERAGFRGRAVGRLDGDELVSVPTDEPEDCREAEGPEAADEPGLGDDAAEGGAGGGGAGEVGRGVEAQEDLCYGGPQVPEKGKA
jgi:hypothetical protein